MAGATAKDKMVRARARLVLNNPFIGVLALRLRLIEDTTCDTAWVDGVTLGYNPTWIGSLSSNETEAVIAHEVFHCVFQHMSRRNNRDHTKWNIAGDYVINANLKAANFILPEEGLIDMAFKDWTTDRVYEQLPSPEEQDKNTLVIFAPQSSEEKRDEREKDTGTRLNNTEDPGNCGSVRDAPTNTVSDIKQLEGEWKIAAAQAARAAKMVGKLPGSWEHIIEEILNSKVDWRDVLRDFVQSRARSDYSWAQPNRRFIGQDLILPSLYSDQMGEIVVAVDTSGSVSNGEMAQFFAEVSSIVEDTNPELLHVVQCDTAISHTTKYTIDDMPIPIGERKRHGYGGTDFRPPFRWVEEHNIEPACLIYLTDMECHNFPKEPEYPVIWVSTTKRTENPPFGEVVCL